FLLGAARAQPARLDTRQDRHPQVRRDRDGNFVFRNMHLVAVLEKRGEGYGPLVLYPSSRPTQPASEPIATVAGPFTGSPRIAGDDRVIFGRGEGAGRAETEIEIGRDPWLNWSERLPAGGGEGVLSVRSARESGYDLLVPGITRESAPEADRRPESAPEPVDVETPRLTSTVAAFSQDETTAAVMWDYRPERGEVVPALRYQAGSRTQPPLLELRFPAGNSRAGTTRRSAKLLVLREEQVPTAAIRSWTEAYLVERSDLFGQRVLDTPRYPREWVQERRLSRQALVRDAAEPTALGTLLLLTEGEMAQDPAARRELRSRADQALQALQRDNRPLDPRLAYRVGGVLASLQAEREAADARIREQLANGSWPAGERVSTFPDTLVYRPANLAVVIENALPLLRYAAISGDSAAAGAGIRAVNLLEREYGLGRSGDSPRSSLENHGLGTLTGAAETYLLAYQVTGERRYLDGARFWADQTLPYVYLWSRDDRPAQRGAALAKLGDDVARQPQALDLARVLAELDRVRPDGIHYDLARSIIASAEHQQATSGDAAGTLPEFWNVQEGQGSGARISPAPLLAAIDALLDYDTEVAHVRVRTGPDRLFVASGAAIRDATTSAMRLRMNLRWLGGQDTFTTVTGVPARPIS
ncbi:MAG TPA: hypothetical protein VFU47_16880, partial [Armatimonadota bacterium]|nr:hypothetical protein [Armatimonadota bacterium]